MHAIADEVVRIIAARDRRRDRVLVASGAVEEVRAEMRRARAASVLAVMKEV